jgi:nucleotide-binding universal stress UspA family protein
MKSILVAVDFSISSENAAYYAYYLAKQIKANIILCHAIYIPKEVPIDSFGGWPGYNFESLREESTKSLDDLALKMRNYKITFHEQCMFQPKITLVADIGEATEVIIKLANREKAQLIVMGMKGTGAFTTLLFGSKSRNMIDQSNLPLILVSEEFVFKAIGKIAFAASLAGDEIGTINALVSFAKYFDANLLVAHVSDSNGENEKSHKRFKSFLNDVTCKINYDKIYFRHVDKASVDKGLNWLGEYGMINLLVMVHLHKGLFDRLFSSHTHAQANHLNVPLMIMPAGLYPVF